jgi:alanyl aminopeptidase
LEAIEIYFDTPYPYAKLDFIAVPSSIGGAMENAGAITYDEFLVLMDDNSPVTQRRTYTYIHAHELAHMWFGDLVTPFWWTDVWLNEAFATWLSYKIAQGYRPAGNFDRLVLDGALRAMRADSLASSRQIREPVLRDAEISDVFDSITYDKGAGVLAMLESYVGEENFREGVRRHIARFPHGVANSDDFVTSMAEGSGRPEIEGAFRSFIDQPGVPLVEARLHCPSDTLPRVHVSQSRYRPLGSAIDTEGQSWQLPVCITHWGDTGRGRTCALVSASEDVIELGTPSCPETVHPNAEGAGYYRFSLDDSGWAALTANASSLTPNEALAAVDSLDAGFRAGVLSADIFVDGLVALAARPEWDVASAVSSRFV